MQFSDEPVTKQLLKREAETLLHHQGFTGKVDLLLGKKPPPKETFQKKDWNFYKTDGFVWNNLDRIPPSRKCFHETPVFKKGERVSEKFEKKKEALKRKEKSRWCNAVLEQRNQLMIQLYERQSRRMELQERSCQDSRADTAFVAVCDSRRNTLTPIPAGPMQGITSLIEEQKEKAREEWSRAQEERRLIKEEGYHQERKNRLLKERDAVRNVLTARVKTRLELQEKAGLPTLEAPRSSMTSTQQPSPSDSMHFNRSATAQPRKTTSSASFTQRLHPRTRTAPPGMDHETPSSTYTSRTTTAQSSLRPRSRSTNAGVSRGGIGLGSLDLSESDMFSDDEIDLESVARSGNRGATGKSMLERGLTTKDLNAAVPSLVGVWSDRCAKRDFPEYDVN